MIDYEYFLATESVRARWVWEKDSVAGTKIRSMSFSSHTSQWFAILSFIDCAYTVGGE